MEHYIWECFLVFKMFQTGPSQEMTSPSNNPNVFAFLYSILHLVCIKFCIIILSFVNPLSFESQSTEYAEKDCSISAVKSNSERKLAWCCGLRWKLLNLFASCKMNGQWEQNLFLNRVKSNNNTRLWKTWIIIILVQTLL